jgi:thiamine-phosphate pyrophosphorylase
MKKISECRLYTFVDTGYLRGRSVEDVARQLCEGGSDIIQLRAKSEPELLLLKMAESILRVTEAAGIPLVINDYPKIAIKVGAQYCHLGQEDFFDAGFRTAAQVTGCPKVIGLGLSSHSEQQALRALKAEPDYIAVGPVFKTGTKPFAEPVTLQLVKWADKNVRTIPWFAIGGINLNNIDEVLGAGARRICVVSAILNELDIAEACRKFKDKLEQYPLESN